MSNTNTLTVLYKLISKVKCKPGWSFRAVETDEGLRLIITVEGYDSSKPDEKQRFDVAHYFPIPETTFNERSWKRWLFEQCRRLENHELGEWFRFGAERPFAPLHGPGEDPYTVHEFRDEIDARTTQDGSTRLAYK